MQTPSSYYEHTAVVTGSVGGVMSIIIICQSIVIIILIRKIRNLIRYVDIAIIRCDISDIHSIVYLL